MLHTLKTCERIKEQTMQMITQNISSTYRFGTNTESKPFVKDKNNKVAKDTRNKQHLKQKGMARVY